MTKQRMRSYKTKGKVLILADKLQKTLNQKVVYKNKFSIEHLKESSYQTWKVLSKTRCDIDRDDIISTWKCQQL